MQVEPFERNVSVDMRKPVVFILDKCALDKDTSVYVNVAVARGHHLTSETGKREENLISKAGYAPGKGEIEMKG